MAFVKLVKNNAYYKRYQTKFRRRREGKTDYYARKRLITVDNNKYNLPKYRLVTRITSGKVICQITYATLVGDRIMAQASSTELRKYGLEAGLTNYSACYATGLLLARRLLKQTGMDKLYPGVDKVTGDLYRSGDSPDVERRPFRAILDIGLVRTTTGNRVFGCLKGAVDGGIDIPHSTKRFPGSYEEEGDRHYEASVHRDRIFGAHVDKYMAQLKEESQEEYLKQFSKWDACLKKAGVASVEKLMEKVHASIRKNPDFTKKAAAANPKREHSKYSLPKLNAAQRKERATKKIEIALAQH
jgi:large subunit ribosomal protein L5e